MTSQIKSSTGRISKTLSAGASEIITVETTPLANQNLAVGDAMNVDIRAFMDATDVSNNLVRDVARATTVVSPTIIAGTDAAIRKASETNFLGAGVINTTGASQTSTQTTPRNRAAIFVVRLKNSGNADDKIKLAASGDTSGWNAKYFDNATNADITSAVNAATWSTPSLAANANYDVRLEITPASGVALNTSKTWTLTATSAKDATKKDVVKATATASVN